MEHVALLTPLGLKIIAVSVYILTAQLILLAFSTFSYLSNEMGINYSQNTSTRKTKMQIMLEGTVREETMWPCRSLTALHRRHGDIFREDLCSHLWKCIILNVTIESLVLRKVWITDINRSIGFSYFIIGI